MAPRPVAPAAPPASTSAVAATDRSDVDEDATGELAVATVVEPNARIALNLVVLVLLLGLLGTVLYLFGRTTGVIAGDKGLIAVPDVVGRDVTAAQAELQDRGLTFRIDRQPSDAVAESRVFDQ